MGRPKGAKNKPKDGKLIVAPKDPGKNLDVSKDDDVDVMDDLSKVIMQGSPEQPSEQDILLIQRMGAHHMPPLEVCAVLDISRSRFEASLAMQAAHQRGIEMGKSTLRRLQWKKAKAGDTIMLIFLGKQILGQADKLESKTDDGSKDADRQSFEDKLKRIIDVTPEGQADSVPDPGREGDCELLLAPVGEGQPNCPIETVVVEARVYPEIS